MPRGAAGSSGALRAVHKAADTDQGGKHRLDLRQHTASLTELRGERVGGERRGGGGELSSWRAGVGRLRPAISLTVGLSHEPRSERAWTRSQILLTPVPSPAGEGILPSLVQIKVMDIWPANGSRDVDKRCVAISGSIGTTRASFRFRVSQRRRLAAKERSAQRWCKPPHTFAGTATTILATRRSLPTRNLLASLP